MTSVPHPTGWRCWARPGAVFIVGYLAMEGVEHLAGRAVALFVAAVIFVLCIMILAPEKEAPSAD